ncbi:MAG: DUF5674 family protein [Bacteroidales bacterium]|jgi:hypothetical protein|nr:DUF5674 family protein [Bacteroidales bacterium]
MILVEKNITREQLKPLTQNFFSEMVKGVIDIQKGVLALDAELHSDLEKMLLENGSDQSDLWGINLYPYKDGDDFVEFESLINIRPWQGNRSRLIEDETLQAKIRLVLKDRII